ncbi:hypothetical protein B0A48_01239 [Cryoendolithus antarcticus]|uniref:Uncharacterized protein n=1 Tax=Cryoendolithus antarcticus TaxID=1507870 RepID=A0A1V8TSM8_9PEZI|nr:hypothetical protein B0A48_01239 [Cryoendolithus antarcticus]
MVSKILFWSGFGVAVRLWQLGIEMRPFFYRQGLFAYPVYGLIGASFGYWLQGMEDNQMRYLGDTRDRLLEKRRRRAEREGGVNAGSEGQKVADGIFAGVKEGRDMGFEGREAAAS